MEQQALQPHRNVTSGPDEWPNTACKRGSAYLMDTPFTNPDDGQTHRIILMDERDWYKHGTDMEQMRRTLKLQDQRIKELHADIAVREKMAADLLSRLETYRAKDKDEKRAQIEASLSIAELPAETFNPQGTST